MKITEGEKEENMYQKRKRERGKICIKKRGSERGKR
jgi:hypothetical protein